MTIEIIEIQHGSPEYALEVTLRNKILRQPLGLHFSHDELAKECTDIHLGAFSGTVLIGCLLLRRLDEHTIKMRQVAVDDSVQGRGVGRLLVAAGEERARALGFTAIELSARETAVAFYLKLGYEVCGGPFTEVTLPHRKMRKII